MKISHDENNERGSLTYSLALTERTKAGSEMRIVYVFFFIIFKV